MRTHRFQNIAGYREHPAPVLDVAAQHLQVFLARSVSGSNSTPSEYWKLEMTLHEWDASRSATRQSTFPLIRIPALGSMGSNSGGLHTRVRVCEVTQLQHINDFQRSASLGAWWKFMRYQGAQGRSVEDRRLGGHHWREKPTSREVSLVPHPWMAKTVRGSTGPEPQESQKGAHPSVRPDTRWNWNVEHE
jgi:hypothetical protein